MVRNDYISWWQWGLGADIREFRVADHDIDDQPSLSEAQIDVYVARGNQPIYMLSGHI